MIGFLGLAGLALAFMLVPMFRRTASVDRADSRLHARLWYQHRLTELGDEAVDPSVRDEIAQDLAFVLLDEVADYDQETRPSPDGAHSSAPSVDSAAPMASSSASNLSVLGWVSALSVMALILAGGTYSILGSPFLYELRGAEEVLELSADTEAAQIRAWQMRLQGHLDAVPDDAKSLYLLGHSHLKLAEFAPAAAAFAAAHEEASGDVSIKFYWLQSRYLAARGVLDETSQNLANEILASDPTNAQILEMLAVAAINAGDAATAVAMLNRTLNGALSPEREDATLAAIASLRKTIVQPSPGVAVAVSATQTPPSEATVFIVARPVGGGMPYAALRRPARALPIRVRLDDLVSMSPNRKLSAAATFEVLVRVSLGGVAQSAEGDWEWVSEPFAGAALLESDLPVEIIAKIGPPSS